MKQFILLVLLMFSVPEINAQASPRILQGSTVIIQMFTCANARIVSIDNLGETDIFELPSTTLVMVKKYMENLMEAQKLLAKALNSYFENGYQIQSSTTGSVDDCGYTYILYKK
jgi:predicted GNAT superfamily acetyltransferase